MPIRSTILLILLFFFLVGVFLVFPRLDIAVSRYFFDEQYGFTFIFHPVMRFINSNVPFLTRILLTIYSIALFIWLCFRWHPKFLPPIATLYLLVTLIVGPGLIVSLFKENTGRARPREITEFHGTKVFSAPFEISHECHKNCSFISGHSAIGFYFLAFVLLATKYRKTIFTAGLFFAFVVALSRIATGKHFLSDVLFSGYFTFLTAFILYYYVFQLHRIQTNSVKG